MGLDMYLRGVKYFNTCTYDYSTSGDPIKEVDPIYQAITDAAGIEQTNEIGSCECQLQVMYWRKANQIHKWFDDHIQGGCKNCEPARFTKEQLTQLHSECCIALAHKDAEVLPTQSGFFFGSTEIDEWYWKDLEVTRDELEKLLKADQFDEYVYLAWW